MTFKDLLEQFSFDEIAPAFKTLWQRNAPEQAARLDMEGWRTGAFPLLYPFGISLGKLCADDRHELRCLCKRRQCTHDAHPVWVFAEVFVCALMF